MGNNTNPAEIYSGTTWELLPDNKFLKTGSTPLQQKGSNSVSISKANLPADKLQVESFSLTRGTMDIIGSISALDEDWGLVENPIAIGAFYAGTSRAGYIGTGVPNRPSSDLAFQASRSWTGSTSSASPYTTNMGNGTPLTINPEHITIKAWKRLS